MSSNENIYDEGKDVDDEGSAVYDMGSSAAAEGYLEVDHKAEGRRASGGGRKGSVSLAGVRPDGSRT